MFIDSVNCLNNRRCQRIGLDITMGSPYIRNMEGSTDWDALRRKTDKEVVAAARADADAKPLTPTRIERLLPVVDVKALRKKLGMTQTKFCKAFKLSIGTVRDWEQRRFVPEGPARVLLTVIARDSEAVMLALQEQDLQKSSKSGSRKLGKKLPHKSNKTKYPHKSVAA